MVQFNAVRDMRSDTEYHEEVRLQKREVLDRGGSDYLKELDSQKREFRGKKDSIPAQAMNRYLECRETHTVGGTLGWMPGRSSVYEFTVIDGDTCRKTAQNNFKKMLLIEDTKNLLVREIERQIELGNVFTNKRDLVNHFIQVFGGEYVIVGEAIMDVWRTQGRRTNIGLPAGCGGFLSHDVCFLEVEIFPSDEDVAAANKSKSNGVQRDGDDDAGTSTRRQSKQNPSVPAPSSSNSAGGDPNGRKEPAASGGASSPPRKTQATATKKAAAKGIDDSSQEGTPEENQDDGKKATKSNDGNPTRREERTQRTRNLSSTPSDPATSLNEDGAGRKDGISKEASTEEAPPEKKSKTSHPATTGGSAEKKKNDIDPATSRNGGASRKDAISKEPSTKEAPPEKESKTSRPATSDGRAEKKNNDSLAREEGSASNNVTTTENALNSNAPKLPTPPNKNDAGAKLRASENAPNPKDLSSEEPAGTTLSGKRPNEAPRCAVETNKRLKFGIANLEIGLHQKFSGATPNVAQSFKKDETVLGAMQALQKRLKGSLEDDMMIHADTKERMEVALKSYNGLVKRLQELEASRRLSSTDEESYQNFKQKVDPVGLNVLALRAASHAEKEKLNRKKEDLETLDKSIQEVQRLRNSTQRMSNEIGFLTKKVNDASTQVESLKGTAAQALNMSEEMRQVNRALKQEAERRMQKQVTLVNTQQKEAKVYYLKPDPSAAALSTPILQGTVHPGEFTITTSYWGHQFKFVVNIGGNETIKHFTVGEPAQQTFHI